LAHEQEDEHRRAHDAEYQGDGYLERHDHDTADDVADRHDTDAGEEHPGDVRAQVGSAHHGDQVGDYEAEEGRGSDHDGDHAGVDRHESHAEDHDPLVVESDVGGEGLAEPRNGEPVGDEHDHGGDDQHDPQGLVAADLHPGEAAREPAAEHLQQVEL